MARKKLPIKVPKDLKRPDVDISKLSPNYIIAVADISIALRDAGNSLDAIELYKSQAKFGSYQHMVIVTEAYVNLI